MNSPYLKENDLDILDIVEKDISLYRNSENILIAGDLNAKTKTESDCVSDHDDQHSPIYQSDLYISDNCVLRRNNDNHPVDEQGRKILELCKNSRIRILNGRMPGDRLGAYTRYPLSLRETPSTLDYMASDVELLEKMKSFVVLPHNGLSDHDCLKVTIESKIESFSPEEAINIVKRQHIKYATPEQFKMKLDSPLGKQILAEYMNKHKTGADSENMYADLVQIFTKFSHKTNSGDKKRYRNKNKRNDKKPWYSSECRKLKNTLNRQEKRFRRSPFDRDVHQTLMKARKDFKSACKKSEKRLRDILTDKLYEAESKNPEEFWKIISQMRNWGKIENDRSFAISPREWHTYFKELFRGKEDVSEQIHGKLKALEAQPVFTELSYSIKNQEILTALKKINQKASPGYDKVSAKMLYEGRLQLMPILSLFLNKTFSEVGHPKEWALNYLKIILKKG